LPDSDTAHELNALPLSPQKGTRFLKNVKTIPTDGCRVRVLYYFYPAEI